MIIFGLGLLIGLVFPLLFKPFFWLKTRKRLRLEPNQVISLKIKTDENTESVRIHNSLLNSLGLKRGQRFDIISLSDGRNGKYPIIGNNTEIVWSRTKDGAEGVIELPADVLAELFPANDKGDGDTATFFLKKSTLSGVKRYWWHEDDSTAFANQFTILLALGILFVELGFGFIPATIKLILLVAVVITFVFLFSRRRRGV